MSAASLCSTKYLVCLAAMCVVAALAPDAARANADIVGCFSTNGPNKGKSFLIITRKKRQNKFHYSIGWSDSNRRFPLIEGGTKEREKVAQLVEKSFGMRANVTYVFNDMDIVDLSVAAITPPMRSKTEPRWPTTNYVFDGPDGFGPLFRIPCRR